MLALNRPINYINLMTKPTPESSSPNVYTDMYDRQFANVLRTASDSEPSFDTQSMLGEAADRLARYDRLQRLLGLLAPAGTAPRTAIEQIYLQSATDAEESPIVLELRHMLSQHWGEWTPAIREAEGLPPAQPE